MMLMMLGWICSHWAEELEPAVSRGEEEDVTGKNPKCHRIIEYNASDIKY